jgi:hypothetical protein
VSRFCLVGAKIERLIDERVAHSGRPPAGVHTVDTRSSQYGARYISGDRRILSYGTLMNSSQLYVGRARWGCASTRARLMTTTTGGAVVVYSVLVYITFNEVCSVAVCLV